MECLVYVDLSHGRGVCCRRAMAADKCGGAEKETLMTNMEGRAVYFESFTNDLYDPSDSDPDDKVTGGSWGSLSNRHLVFGSNPGYLSRPRCWCLLLMACVTRRNLYLLHNASLCSFLLFNKAST